MTRRWTDSDLAALKRPNLALVEAPEPRKYRNKPCMVDGHAFDSRAEACRYIDLKLLEKAGKISDLRIHPVYRIELCNAFVCKMIPDFDYLENGKKVVEDVKSKPTITRLYKLKKRLLKIATGLDITEVFA